MIHDKLGKRILPGQLVDLRLDGQHTLDGMYTADVVHVEDSSAIKRTPGFAVIRIMLQIPAAVLSGKERIMAYVVREAPSDGRVDGRVPTGPQRIEETEQDGQAQEIEKERTN